MEETLEELEWRHLRSQPEQREVEATSWFDRTLLGRGKARQAIINESGVNQDRNKSK